MNYVTEAIKIHGLKNLAKKLDVSYQAVRKWESNRVPAERLVQFEEVTGIDRELVRPELYQRNNAA